MMFKYGFSKKKIHNYIWQKFVLNAYANKKADI